MPKGDDRSVKIKSLEAAKIMKIKWLVSRLYRSRFLQVNIRWKALDEIYKIYMLLHRSDLDISGNVRHEFWHFFTKFQITSSKSCNFRTPPNFVGISQNVQKMLPHTEHLKKILGFFILRDEII